MKETLTQSQYQERAFQTILAKSIIANQYAMNLNEKLKGTQYYKANVKKYGLPYNLALIKAECSEFSKIFLTDNNKTNEFYKDTDMVLDTLSRAVFVDPKEVDLVIKALAKDRDSILGIAKKIMR